MISKDEILSFLYLPFRVLGKEEVSVSEYVNTFSFRLNKASPSQMKELLDLSVKNQLLILKKEILTQSVKIENHTISDFDIEEVIDFLKKETNKPVLIKIAEIIAQKLNITIKDVIARVNLKQKEFDSLMAPEIIALSIAEEEGIDLGDFPIGKWLDANWDAVWEFNSDNIRILDTEGGVYYDFNGKTIKDFKISPSTSGLKLTFRCEETGKKYEFIKGLTNLDLKMVIDTDTGNHYEVDLPKQ